MSRRSLLTVAVLVLAALGLLAWAFAPRPIEVELAVASTGRFETSIDEDGRTRLRERYVVSAPLAGRLARIPLREGDRVDADAVLATLTPVLAPMQDERTLREQQARLEATDANLQRSAARVARARVAVQQAANELRRSEQLAQQGFIAATRIDADRLAAAAAQRELEAAVAEQDIALHERDQARAALGMARQGGTPGGRQFEVRAPVAGRVLRVLQPSEATVALGAPLLELGDTTRMEVVAELLTTDALRAAPGSPVVITQWGGSADLAGRVLAVEPAAFTKVSALGVEEQRVNVRIEITSPAAQWAALGDGFRVGVRIITLTVEDALRVPVSAVFPLPAQAEDTPPRHAVFVVESGRVRVRPVELAGRNATQAWLRGGLQAGASVVVYPPAALADGVRVRARRV